MVKLLSKINFNIEIMGDNVKFTRTHDKFKDNMTEITYNMTTDLFGFDSTHVSRTEFDVLRTVVNILRSAYKEENDRDILIMSVEGIPSYSGVRMTRSDFRSLIYMLKQHYVKYDVVYESKSVIKKITHDSKIIIKDIE